MCAAMTPLPVLGVPIESKALGGQDSLFSIVQMPAGIPVGTLAIGRSGISTSAACRSYPGARDTDIASHLDGWRRPSRPVSKSASDDE
jgi:5-(carboxyamino)imidazole ribonucleotide mutase